MLQSGQILYGAFSYKKERALFMNGNSNLEKCLRSSRKFGEVKDLKKILYRNTEFIVSSSQEDKRHILIHVSVKTIY